MLILSRRDLAANLAAYGEHEAAARIHDLSADDYQRISEIGFRHALDGHHWLLAGCLAAIEVIEGKARNLRRPRRDWSEVPPQFSGSDPLFLEVESRFAEYAGGDPLKRAEIYASLGSVLVGQLPGFRYLKTHRQLRRAFEGGTAFICLEIGHGVLHLRFGVLIDAVEKTRAVLFGGPPRARRPYPETISVFSANMGPRSPHWACPVEASWPMLGTFGLSKAGPEIAALIDRYVLPYLSEHESPLNVRQTLILSPGKALDFCPSQTVFSIDHLARKRDWLEEDYIALKERAKNYIASHRDRIPLDYERVLSRWDDPLAE
jgi:hypothetical protein